MRRSRPLVLAAIALLVTACAQPSAPRPDTAPAPVAGAEVAGPAEGSERIPHAAIPTPAKPAAPRRDAILVAGTPFPTGAPVVTFRDEDGYDGHLERCFFDASRLSPRRPVRGCEGVKRYSRRSLDGLLPATRTRVEREGWDLESLRERVDLFVLHYDVCGTSRRCFDVLHDQRGLSVHFLLDVDGTIYQTLDLTARARHATIANDRSVGVEIAQIGAWPRYADIAPWYVRDSGGQLRIAFPEACRPTGIRTPGFIARPAFEAPLAEALNGRTVHQHAYTAAQYESLARLLAALHRALPRIRLAAPETEAGRVATGVLSPEEFTAFSGVLGHHHVQANKVDPGPALDWEWLLRRARSLPDPASLEPRSVLRAAGPGTPRPRPGLRIRSAP